MFPFSNVHTHTVFSDGKNTAEEMVRAALAAGFTSLGFSDHGHSPWDVCGMRLEDEPLYRAEVRHLKEKYAGEIELALGYEHDATAPDTDLSVYDYAIESVHFVHADGGFVSVDESADALRRHIEAYFGGDPYRMARDYFDNVAEALSRTAALVAGHIDLVTKFNEDGRMFDTEDPRFSKPAMECVRIAAERGMLVEINTGAMSRGYRTAPYPSEALLKQLNALGGRITITSDCHRAEWISFGFDRACALAQACGFRSVWIWKDGGFREMPLQDTFDHKGRYAP